MAEPVAVQVMLFLYTVLTGVLAGFLYDFYTSVGYVLRLKKLAVHAGDVLFWLLLTAGVYALLWHLNQGEFRFFVLVGLGTGAGLYHCFARRPARRMLIGLLERLFRFLGLVRRVVCRILSLVWWPFRVLWSGLTFPFRLLGRAWGKAGRAVKSKAAGWMPAPLRNFNHRLANLRRKIGMLVKRSG